MFRSRHRGNRIRDRSLGYRRRLRSVGAAGGIRPCLQKAEVDGHGAMNPIADAENLKHQLPCSASSFDGRKFHDFDVAAELCPDILEDREFRLLGMDRRRALIGRSELPVMRIGFKDVVLHADADGAKSSAQMQCRTTSEAPPWMRSASALPVGDFWPFARRGCRECDSRRRRRRLGDSAAGEEGMTGVHRRDLARLARACIRRRGSSVWSPSAAPARPS